MNQVLKSKGQRGYVILLVMIAGIILSAISITLLNKTFENQQSRFAQENSTRAYYAAESAINVTVKELEERFSSKVDDDLKNITKPQIPWTTFEDTEVVLVNPKKNYEDADICANDSDCAPNQCSESGRCMHSTVERLSSGDFAGLLSYTTPVKVTTTATVHGAKSTVSSIARLNFIPLFQFALFFDGDLEFQSPPDMTIAGPVHTNGGFYPIRKNNGKELRFESKITIAKEQHSRSLHDPSQSISGSSGVFVNGENLDEGIEDNPTSAEQVSFHQRAGFAGLIQDKHSGVKPIRLPIPIGSETQRDPVTSRPDTCGSKNAAGDASFEQGVGIHLIRRPDSLTKAASYPQEALNPWTETYGPFASKVNYINNGAIAEPWATFPCLDDPMTAAIENSSQAHCQNIANSVPVINFTVANDNPLIGDKRSYWKATIRIIDGIWYDRNNKVIFNPETWDLRTGGSLIPWTDANVQLGYAFARVLRYSWFWDARESRVYPNTIPGNTYQRGLQMRVTDFDVLAFHRLIQNPAAVALIFAGEPIPEEGIHVYISETFDRRYDDRAVNDTERVSNVRNFLDFHTMENAGPSSEQKAKACLTTVSNITNLAVPLSPCARGWSPYFLWGDGAEIMTGEPTSVSLTSTLNTPTETVNLSSGNLNVSTSAGAYGRCLNPSSVPLAAAGDPDFTNPTQRPAPCIAATVTPQGPENAVRFVRAQMIPFQNVGTPLGLTFSTDNRSYIYGDVNVTATGRQDIPGKIAFMADSVTILSQRFNDLVMQRGGNGAGINEEPQLYSYPGQPPLNNVLLGIGLNGLASGSGPDLCRAWNSFGGSFFRKSSRVKIYASLMVGDVPGCKDSFTRDGDGSSSGGVNNLPRFLEDMAGAEVLISGSIISMFRAEQGNARFISVHSSDLGTATQWRSGQTVTPYQITTGRSCVYRAPVRHWSFDTALEDLLNLPPGTPRIFEFQTLRHRRH